MSIVPESIEYHIGGLPTPLLMMFVTWGILIVLSLVLRSRMSLVPHGISSGFELIFSFIYKFADTAIGKESHKYYPLFIGIFLFVITGNIIGLIPGLSSPTASLNITLGLALITFCYYQFHGIREHGLGYIKHFMGPKLPWYLFPINMLMFVVEIISHLARIVSLSLRLFCNIFAKEILLGILAGLLVQFVLGSTMIEKGLSISVLFLRTIIILLGTLVSFVQAYIFTALAIIYIAGAISESH